MTPGEFRERWPSIAAIPCVSDLLDDYESMVTTLVELGGTLLPTPVELAEQIIGRQHAQIQRIAEFVEEGGRTDGAHHKQFFLAQIAAELGIILPDQGVAP